MLVPSEIVPWGSFAAPLQLCERICIKEFVKLPNPLQIPFLGQVHLKVGNTDLQATSSCKHYEILTPGTQKFPREF